MTDIRDEVVAALAVAGIDPATDTCTMDDHHGEPFTDAILAALAARDVVVMRKGELDALLAWAEEQEREVRANIGWPFAGAYANAFRDEFIPRIRALTRQPEGQ